MEAEKIKDSSTDESEIMVLQPEKVEIPRVMSQPNIIPANPPTALTTTDSVKN